MLIIPSLVLVVSFLAQITVLAAPLPLNHDVLIHARAPSLDDEASQILVTRNHKPKPKLKIKIPEAHPPSGPPSLSSSVSTASSSSPKTPGPYSPLP
ncbi:hypothetical protein BYT27DRAFT_7255315 [Phlegmacium glaucopus]|nr:hypothetical protein BYT27DRAFT_7255315 [Phlegmacium glaucopus]